MEISEEQSSAQTRPQGSTLSLIRQAFKNRPKLTLTQRGSGFCALTLGVGFVALNSGNNLIYLVLGMMLALILSSGVLSSINLHKVRVKRRHELRGSAGIPLKVKLKLVNLKKSWPSMGIGVEDPPVYRLGYEQRSTVIEDQRGRSMYLFRLKGSEEESLRYTLTLQRRGHYTLEGARIYTRFPFGFFEKSIGLKLQLHLIIYPRRDATLHPEALMRLGTQRQSSSSLNTELRSSSDQALRLGSDERWVSIEPYLVGEPLKHIHWKSSARRGELMVRRGESSARELCSVWINPHYHSTSKAPSVDEQDAYADLIMTLLYTLWSRGDSVKVTGLSSIPLMIVPDSTEMYQLMETLVRFTADASTDTIKLDSSEAFILSLPQGLSLLEMTAHQEREVILPMTKNDSLYSLKDHLTPRPLQSQQTSSKVSLPTKRPL